MHQKPISNHDKPAASNEAGLLQIAAAEWAGLRETSDIGKLLRFIQHFKGTYYAGLAQDRVDELQAAERERAEARAREEAKRRAEQEAAAKEARKEAEAQRFAPVTFLIGAKGAARRETKKPGESFRDFGGAPEMVVVPPGKFWMGSQRR